MVCWMPRFDALRRFQSIFCDISFEQLQGIFLTINMYFFLSHPTQNFSLSVLFWVLLNNNDFLRSKKSRTSSQTWNAVPSSVLAVPSSAFYQLTWNAVPSLVLPLFRKFRQRGGKRVIKKQDVMRIRPNVASFVEILRDFREINFNQGCKRNAKNLWR